MYKTSITTGKTKTNTKTNNLVSVNQNIKKAISFEIAFSLCYLYAVYLNYRFSFFNIHTTADIQTAMNEIITVNIRKL